MHNTFPRPVDRVRDPGPADYVSRDHESDRNKPLTRLRANGSMAYKMNKHKTKSRMKWWM